MGCPVLCIAGVIIISGLCVDLGTRRIHLTSPSRIRNRIRYWATWCCASIVSNSIWWTDTADTYSNTGASSCCIIGRVSYSATSSRRISIVKILFLKIKNWKIFWNIFCKIFKLFLYRVRRFVIICFVSCIETDSRCCHSFICFNHASILYNLFWMILSHLNMFLIGN